MSIFGKNILYFFACVLMCLAAGCSRPASSSLTTEDTSPVYILNSPDNHRLREHLQILPDPDTGYSIQDIVQPEVQDLFVAFLNKTFEPQSHQAYWGKIQLENRLPDAEMHSEWVLNFSSTFTQITLFRQAGNGAWKPEVNDTIIPAHLKNFTPTKSGNWFKLVLPPGEPVTLYFRGTSERTAMPPTFLTDVQPLKVYYNKLVADKTGNALFTGFLLMMLFYNLIKFFIVKDRSYIYYSGYLMMVAVYTAYISKDLEDWLGGFVFSEHPAFFNLFKSSLYLGLMCWLAFIRSFLDLERLLPRWDRYFRSVIWLGPPLMGVFIFLAFRYNFSYVIDDMTTLFYIAKDGFEVLETLKNDERTSHIPIILLTAKADVQNRLAGLRRGADAYLAKPFHQEELLVTVANLLELRRKLQAKYSQWGSVPGNSEAPASGTDPEGVFLQKIRSVVEANLSDTDFEMPQLERALAMSRSQIYRKVKALTGKSPSLFIRSIRLHHGRHLLQTTDLTVSEIAYEVGYSGLNNFSDAFLEEFGERPGKVRG